MKIFKKAVALLLVAIFAVSLTACHPKDEVAVSSGEYKITSAMYSYYLLLADNEAKTIIDNDTKINKEATTFSYYAQTIEGKKFEIYVKELALQKCQNHIALQKMAAEAGVKLDDATISNYAQMATYYWNGSSYANLLEPNGISYDTYEKLYLQDAYYSAYFEKLYEEGGTKAVSKETLKKTLTDKYVAAYVIEHDYSKDSSAKIEDVKKDLEKYVTAFNEGKTFEEVKKMYDDDQKAKTEADKKDEDKKEENKTEDKKEEDKKDETKEESKEETKEESKEESKDESKEESKEEDKKDEEPAPKDKNIKIYTNYDETSSYGVATKFAYFDKVKKLEKGKAALVEDTANKKVYIVQKQDITTDEYYMDSLKSEILYMLKGDELDNAIATYAKSLQYSVNNWAIDQFKVQDIKYPEVDPNTYY